MFEGEISPAKLKKLKQELKKIIDEEEDSVIVYELRTTSYTSREIIGLEKGGEQKIL